MTPEQTAAFYAAKGLKVTVGPPARLDPPHATPGAAKRVPRERGKPNVVPGKRAFVMVPPAPGVNNLYLNVPGVGRVKTKRYREWIEAATPCLWGLSVPPPPWSVSLTVCAGTGWRKGRDLDGVVKGTLDLLVSAGLLTDDSTEYIRRVTVGYDPDGKPKDVAAVRIEIRQWAAGA